MVWVLFRGPSRTVRAALTAHGSPVVTSGERLDPGLLEEPLPPK